MGSHDGAEVCELVGLFLLNELNELFGKDNVGLYRDNGLAIVKNASGPQMDKLRKKIVAMFKKYDLKITTETNLSSIDFSDVFFDLSKNTYRPSENLEMSPRTLIQNQIIHHPLSNCSQV